MTIEGILSELTDTGGQITVVDGDLKIRIKKDKTDFALVEKIKSKKNEIIAFLKNQNEIDGGIRSVEKRHYYDAYPNQVGLSVLFRYRRIFRKYKLDKLIHSYNIPIIIDVKNLDLPVFKRTLWTLLERHESLRTTFLFINNNVKQKIHGIDIVDLPLKFIDIRKKRSKAALLQQYYNKYLGKAFNIVKDLLFNVIVIRSTDEEYRVLFVINHLIADDFSCKLLTEESFHIYSAYGRNEAHCLKPNTQPKEYAAWLNRLLSGTYRDKVKGFLRERILPDTPVFTFEKYYKDPSTPLRIERSYRRSLENDLKAVSLKYRRRIFAEIRGSFHRIYVSDANCYGIQINEALFAELKSLSRALQTTTNNLMNACIFLLIYKLTGRNDIILCVIAMIREDYRLRSIIGWLTTGLLFRNKFRTDQTIGEFVAVTQAGFLEYYQCKYYPLGMVLDDLDISMDSLGLVSINYIHNVDQVEQVYTNYKSHHMEGDLAMCDMDFCFHEFSNCVKVYISYQTDRFEPATIEYFAACLLDVLRFVVKGKDEQILSLCETRAGGSL